MRIGFETTPLALPLSGVGTYTDNLLANLQVLGEDTILPLTHYPAQYRWRENNGTPPRAPIKTLWMQTTLRRQLGELRPDVCHFTNSVAPLWLPYPMVVTIYDMTLWVCPEYHPARRLATMRPIIPLAARQADAIITASHSARDDIVRILGVPSGKVHVVYGAPSAPFRPIGDRAYLEDVRRVYHLPEPFILHVGTLEPRKNLVRLLEAFAQLHLRGSVPHHMVFVGKPGWSYQNIGAAVSRLGIANAVHFLDFVPVDVLAAIYNLADALVFPSLYEGFGLPVVEAMACGTPVITSPNGSLREVAGGAAEYVNPIDTQSIADGIQHILASPARRAELRARGLARSGCFSWERAARLTRRVYRQVAERDAVHEAASDDILLDIIAD